MFIRVITFLTHIAHHMELFNNSNGDSVKPKFASPQPKFKPKIKPRAAVKPDVTPDTNAAVDQVSSPPGSASAMRTFYALTLTL